MKQGDKKLIQVSKFMSYVLRHKPQEIGLVLDPNGWASVEELITKGNSYGSKIDLTPELVKEVVTSNDKQRFALSEDGTKIRASQGHSVEVDLQLEPLLPPTFLYHGTSIRFLKSIQDKGLVKGSRQHVHLSEDKGTARIVGERHGGRTVIFEVAACQMVGAGHKFYRSDNGVWLTDCVPATWLRQLLGEEQWR